jgi:signal peptidase I
LSRRRDRRLAVLLVALAVAVAVGRLMLLKGLVSTVRVHGGSMAEYLPGEHVRARCAACARRWRADAEQWKAESQHFCPQCQAPVVEYGDIDFQAGTRVVIDPVPFWHAAPQRFDVVAFRAAEESRSLAVKRIVALPGEAWEIRGGDLFVEGRRVAKSYEQFKQVATLVNEVAAGNRRAAQRWRPPLNNSAWQLDDSARWRATTSRAHPADDWLAYEHAAAHPAASKQPSPVTDFDPYNPALTRALNPLVDLVAEAHWEGKPEQLALQVHDGYDPLELRYDGPAGELKVYRRQQEITRTSLPRQISWQRSVAWGVCDRQLWMVVDGTVVLQHRLEERPEAAEPSLQPLALSVREGATLVLTQLRVLRDVYYLDPQGLGRDWQGPRLGAKQFAVLGDNPPLSIDSRHWAGPLEQREILGKVGKR